MKKVWTKFLTNRQYDERDDFKEISAPPYHKPKDHCNKPAYTPLSKWYLENPTESDGSKEKPKKPDIIAFKAAEHAKKENMYEMIACSTETVLPGVVTQCPQPDKKMNDTRQEVHQGTSGSVNISQ